MSSKYKDQPAFPVTSDNFANPQSTGMTVREYAAIQLKVPDSGTAWLDEMICTAHRNELAAKLMLSAMQRLCDHSERGGVSNEIQEYELIGKLSHEAADAMLKGGNT